MNETKLQKQLSVVFSDIKMLMWEPMAKHTSFKIGGPAEIMVFPNSADQLAEILKKSALLDCKITILGAGTNVLAPDELKAFTQTSESVVVCLKDSLDFMERLDRNRVRIAAGVTMARAAVFACKEQLSGFEFAHGIPGTVGGGVYMNAGAYGGEISQVCESVDVMYMDGTLTTFSAADMQFSYRHSRLEDEGGIVVSAVFALTEGNEQLIREKMQELMQKRSGSQPLSLPSAGSAFKRPVGGYAAALIDEAGLKGFRIGDAAVSEKHAGFVVNLGTATAAEVKALLSEVSELVYKKNGIRLEPEIRIW